MSTDWSSSEIVSSESFWGCVYIVHLSRQRVLLHVSHDAIANFNLECCRGKHKRVIDQIYFGLDKMTTQVNVIVSLDEKLVGHFVKVQETGVERRICRQFNFSRPTVLEAIVSSILLAHRVLCVNKLL